MKFTRREQRILDMIYGLVVDAPFCKLGHSLLEECYLIRLDDSSPLAKSIVSWARAGFERRSTAAKRVIHALKADPVRYGLNVYSEAPLDILVFAELTEDMRIEKRAWPSVRVT